MKEIKKVQSILYVEDEDAIKQEFIPLIKRFCETLYIASDGLEGLEIYKNHRPKVIVSDIVMPRMDGLKMLENIKQIDEDQHIILTTAFNEIAHLHKAIELQVDAVFIKPFDLRTFFKKLEKIIDSLYLEDKLTEKEYLYQSEIEKNKTISYNYHRQQQELINQSKFAAMGEMISMIAHQWRQPLNSVSLNVGTIVQMVENRKLKKADFDKTVKNINETIEYMSKTISDFSDFLKKSDEKRSLKLTDLVLKPKLLIETKLNLHNVKFKFESHVDTNVELEIEGSKFYQVIMNIYHNALDEFTSKKVENPYIKVSIDQNEKQYILSISDNAGGIPQNIMNRIFEPYFSTKSKNGTGLGLYMCKRIMNEYFDGDIKVQNSEAGAVFTINFAKPSKEEDILEDICTKCYKWEKSKGLFQRNNACSHKELIEQSNIIFKTLDTLFINYEVDEKLNIILKF